MRKRRISTALVLATTLAIGAAFPATAATSVGPGVQSVLDRLPDDVVAGALVAAATGVPPVPGSEQQ